MHNYTNDVHGTTRRSKYSLKQFRKVLDKLGEGNTGAISSYNLNIDEEDIRIYRAYKTIEKQLCGINGCNCAPLLTN